MAQKEWEDDSITTGDELPSSEFIEMANRIESIAPSDDEINITNFTLDGETVTSSGNDLDKAAQERFSYSTGHSEWATGVTNDEINRFVLQTGEQLVVERVEFRQKGGGSSSSASVRVYDNDAGSAITSQDLGGTTKDAGTSNTGATITVELSNTTGSSVIGSVTVIGRIIGA